MHVICFGLLGLVWFVWFGLNCLIWLNLLSDWAQQSETLVTHAICVHCPAAAALLSLDLLTVY